MADRRMFSKTIIDSDAFLDLPISAQALYFHMAMRADDDGFINKPRAIMNMVGAKNDDAKILCERKFLIPFESGVVVVKHWRIHNFIRKDTYHETKYKFEKASLFLDENDAYSLNPQVRNESVTSPLRERNETDTQDRLGKDRLVQSSIDNSADAPKTRKKKAFVPPTYEEVLEYAREREREDIAERFYDYFSVGNWKDSSGKQVQNWKQKFVTWCQKNNIYTAPAKNFEKKPIAPAPDCFHPDPPSNYAKQLRESMRWCIDE